MDISSGKTSKTSLTVGILLATALVGTATAFGGSQSPLNGLVEQLDLADAQQESWATIQGEAEAVRTQRRASIAEVRRFLEAELDSPDPNLRAVSAQVDAAIDEALGAWRALREQRLAFYETLSPEQQAIVHAELQQQLEDFDRMRRRFRRFLGDRFPAAG